MKVQETISIVDLDSQLEQMKKRLVASNYSDQTVRNYIRSVVYMSDYLSKHPRDTSIEDITDYLYYQKHENTISWRTMKLYVAGLRWYYRHIEYNETLAKKIPYPKEELHLPEILSREDLSRLFTGCYNQKHRVMLRLIYSSGLRRNELINLKITDVITGDGKFKIRINNSKGKNHCPFLE